MAAVAVFVLLCLIWGSTWLGIKIGLSDAPPLIASGLRFVLAVTILYGIIAVKKYRVPTSMGDTVALAYPGIYIYGVSYALIYIGEQYISSALTAVLFASFPFFVALFSLGMLKAERLHAGGWLGLVLGFAGIVVISYDSLQTRGDLFLGTMLVLLGSAAAAYGVLLHKKRFADCNPVVAAAVQMTFGGVPILAVAFIFERWSDFAVTTASIGSIIYLAVFGSVVAFVSYYWLLARTRAIVVSLIAFIAPLVAIVLGAAWLGESLSLRTAAGTVLTLAGVLLVIRWRRTKPAI